MQAIPIAQVLRANSSLQFGVPHTVLLYLHDLRLADRTLVVEVWIQRSIAPGRRSAIFLSEELVSSGYMSAFHRSVS